jgi:Uracil phosphoribosyltransferase
LARDEATLMASQNMNSLPENLSGRPVYVLDPMVATGGSMVHAIKLLAVRGATDITAICTLAAPEGLIALAASGCRSAWSQLQLMRDQTSLVTLFQALAMPGTVNLARCRGCGVAAGAKHARSASSARRVEPADWPITRSTPDPRQGQPRTNKRQCGIQPAHQSLITDVFRSRPFLCTIHHLINFTLARVENVPVVPAVLDKGGAIVGSACVSGLVLHARVPISPMPLAAIGGDREGLRISAERSWLIRPALKTPPR